MRKVKKAPTEKEARRNDWETPESILAPVRAYCLDGEIGLDPATRKENPTRAKTFFTKKENGLTHPWSNDGVVFCNPPYGPAYKDWLDKIRHEAALGVEMIAIVPCNRFEQKYLHDLIRMADSICFVRKRVPFIIPRSKSKKKSGNPYPSMLLLYNGFKKRFYRAFKDTGLVIGVETRCDCGEVTMGQACRCTPVHKPKPFSSFDTSKCEQHGENS